MKEKTKKQEHNSLTAEIYGAAQLPLSTDRPALPPAAHDTLDLRPPTPYLQHWPALASRLLQFLSPEFPIPSYPGLADGGGSARLGTADALASTGHGGSSGRAVALSAAGRWRHHSAR